MPTAPFWVKTVRTLRRAGPIIIEKVLGIAVNSFRSEDYKKLLEDYKKLQAECEQLIIALVLALQYVAADKRQAVIDIVPERLKETVINCVKLYEKDQPGIAKILKSLRQLFGASKK